MASLKVRQGWDRTVYLVNIVLACITVIPLFLIIGKIVLEGYQQINWDFFTKTAPTAVEAMMAKRANTIEGSHTILPGGIANGIVGTLLMTLVASIIAIPIGLLGGIYLSENRSTRLANVVRFVTDLLQGTPSIVIGIIVYAWVVLPMRGYSALAGAVALAIMMLPPSYALPRRRWRDCLSPLKSRHLLSDAPTARWCLRSSSPLLWVVC